jgi:hypothetical protein
MKEKLTIHNFGPIRDADIDVRDLTIFVGPPATGKSLAAQSLCFLRGIEDFADIAPIIAPIENGYTLDRLLKAMTWWYGNEHSVYINTKTSVRWRSDATPVFKERAIGWVEGQLRLNESFAEEIQHWETMLSVGAFSQLYIPAGRMLFSFLPPHKLVLWSAIYRQWPGCVLRFYQILGDAVNTHWQQQIREISPNYLSAPEFDFVERRIEQIIKGKMLYGPETILLQVGNKQFNPPAIAAGQMEIWPFWAILKTKINYRRLTISQVYFEEPEAHLHPGAQRQVMEIIAFLVSKGIRFVITTHSPYILYAVNNFLMAQKVLDAGRALPEGIPSEVALRYDQVAAYRFDEAGYVHNIMGAEVGLIDEDELDRVADDLGADFTRLQESLWGSE